MNTSERKTKCVCCESCVKCTAGFQKIVQLTDAGVVIYRHPNTQSTETDPDEVFIVENIKNEEIKASEIIPAINKYKSTCLPCRRMIVRAQKLIELVPVIERNFFKSICKQCKALDFCSARIPCPACQDIVKKFVCNKLKTVNQDKAFKSCLTLWLNRVKNLLMDMEEVKPKRRHSTLSDISLQKWLRIRDREISLHLDVVQLLQPRIIGQETPSTEVDTTLNEPEDFFSKSGFDKTSQSQESLFHLKPKGVCDSEVLEEPKGRIRSTTASEKHSHSKRYHERDPLKKHLSIDSLLANLLDAPEKFIRKDFNYFFPKVRQNKLTNKPEISSTALLRETQGRLQSLQDEKDREGKVKLDSQERKQLVGFSKSESEDRRELKELVGKKKTGIADVGLSESERIRQEARIKLKNKSRSPDFHDEKDKKQRRKKSTNLSDLKKSTKDKEQKRENVKHESSDALEGIYKEKRAKNEKGLKKHDVSVEKLVKKDAIPEVDFEEDFSKKKRYRSEIGDKQKSDRQAQKTEDKVKKGQSGKEVQGIEESEAKERSDMQKKLEKEAQNRNYKEVKELNDLKLKLVKEAQNRKGRKKEEQLQNNTPVEDLKFHKGTKIKQKISKVELTDSNQLPHKQLSDKGKKVGEEIVRKDTGMEKHENINIEKVTQNENKRRITDLVGQTTQKDKGELFATASAKPENEKTELTFAGISKKTTEAGDNNRHAKEIDNLNKVFPSDSKDPKEISKKVGLDADTPGKKFAAAEIKAENIGTKFPQLPPPSKPLPPPPATIPSKKEVNPGDFISATKIQKPTLHLRAEVVVEPISPEREKGKLGADHSRATGASKVTKKDGKALLPETENLTPLIFKKKIKTKHITRSDSQLSLESFQAKDKRVKEKISDLVYFDQIIKTDELSALGGFQKEVFQPNIADIEDSALDGVMEVPKNVPEKKAKKSVVGDVKRTLPPKGITQYRLSNPAFINKGWTLLPTEKVMRKVNVYRMRPAHPEFNWFQHNKKKGVFYYDTGERLAEVKEDGRGGQWFYKNGRVALDYYDAEESCAQQRFVVYSNGEPDECGRSRPVTVLAMFDYIGNGIVFDHKGKIRLKYNQTEGVVLDRGIGPVSQWKWHTLNDPPDLQRIMIDTHLHHKDPIIADLGEQEEEKRLQDNEDMLAIEFENFVKEKTKKSAQEFKPFQIKMKALKINENFSLRVLDQATIYLSFREGTTNFKMNLGMLLDSREIIDTDTTEVGVVTTSFDRLPARTDSVAEVQRKVEYVQKLENNLNKREQRLRRPEPLPSVDKFNAVVAKPLKQTIRPTNCAITTKNQYCCGRKPDTCTLYYDNRI